jgi:hypothetical protein
MTIYRVIPNYSGFAKPPHECDHDIYPSRCMQQEDAYCTKCNNGFMVTEDERNQPASWWKSRREEATAKRATSTATLKTHT